MEVASYLFLVLHEGNARLLLVVAPNPKAIEAIEAALGQDDRVSPTCQVLGSFPGCSKPSVRLDVEEVPYHEFMTQMVDPDRILADVQAAGAFTESVRKMASDHVHRRAYPTLCRLLGKESGS